ncbi:MAG: HlyD family type I secretion periplasmic adaptor subunit [Hyphomicrobiaceae bacterium]|nr:HlyD family type I secretion periplasmic adaptor subunit [Hyphomicrobiaceae bacterium]
MASRLEMSFANNLQGALERSARRSAWISLAVVSGLLVAALAWASLAVVEEVTSALGKVVPAQQLQVAQSLEGGIVRELVVREGDRVEQDQVLMRIDDTGFASRLGELIQRRAALAAEITRLRAEANGEDDVAFPAEIANAAPGAVDSERAALRVRREKLRQEKQLLEQQLAQRVQEKEELEARAGKLDGQIAPLQRELDLNKRLGASGNVPEVDILRLERQLAEIVGDRRIVAASLPRVDAAIGEARARLASADSGFAAQVGERIAAVQSDLAVIEETLKAAQDKVVRTAVRSPVRGIVNKLAVTSLGAVVQPGQALAEIVPLDEALLVEARVRPKDVAFVHAGQRATVKLSAYDYMVYGSLEGKVERVSPDTIKDEKGEPFYQVMVRTLRTHLGSEASPLPIIPGLVATVDIQTGSKTVLSYIGKPILRARHEALRER